MRSNNVSWKYTSVLVDSGTKEYLGSTKDGDGNEIKIYRRKGAIIKSISQIMKEEDIDENEAYNKYGKLAFQTAMPQSSIRPRVMEKYSELTNEENDICSIEYVPKTGKNKGRLYEQFYKGKNFRLFAWLKDVSAEIDGELYKRERMGTFWDLVGETKNVNKEGKVRLNSGKKPERLLKNIIEMCTKKGDLVLDFFLGSGTTAAVSHKIERKYIGIEQMDYINEVTINRLKNIIHGDETGVSKDKNIGWQGGGSFVYAELQELNQIYVDRIQQVSSKEELPQVIDDMKEQSLLDFKIDLEKVSVENEDFAKLSLEEQKALLINVLDENQLYLNYSEIADSQYDVSEDVKRFNRSFYEGIDNHG